jgi:single-strand DNA-binding protein
MEITGKVHKLLPIEQISDKFKKRVVVITDPNEKYPQFVPVEFTQDRIALLDSVNEGDEVEVAINLRGREHSGKFYSNIEGWKVTKSSSVKKDAFASQEQAFADQSGGTASPILDGEDDLPF